MATRKFTSATEAFGAIMLVFLAVAIIPVTVIWRGWVLSVLWRWFILPTFPTAPVIGIVQAIGLSTVYGLFSWKYDPHLKDEAFAKVASVALAGPCMSLLLGWVVTWWMP